MQHAISAPWSSRHVRALASRVGHDAVWLMIAGLFCVVEGAVKVTEFAPARLLARRRSRGDATSAVRRTPRILS